MKLGRQKICKISNGFAQYIIINRPPCILCSTLKSNKVEILVYVAIRMHLDKQLDSITEKISLPRC